MVRGGEQAVSALARNSATNDARFHSMQWADRALQVWFFTGFITHREAGARPFGPMDEANPRRQQDRCLEGNVDLQRAGRQVCVQGSDASGLGVHALRDRSPEAEHPGAERVQVNWVDVSGCPSVTTAEVFRQIPVLGHPGFGCSVLRGLVLGPARFLGALEKGGDAFPGQAQVRCRAGVEIELQSLVPTSRSADPAVEVHRVPQADRLMADDAVAQVHDAHRREREGVRDQQAQLQRCRQHEGPGERHDVAARETTDLAVGLQAVEVAADAV